MKITIVLLLERTVWHCIADLCDEQQSGFLTQDPGKRPMNTGPDIIINSKQPCSRR